MNMDITKLPKWAQGHIKGLESKVDLCHQLYLKVSKLNHEMVEMVNNSQYAKVAETSTSTNKQSESLLCPNCKSDLIIKKCRNCGLTHK